MAGMPSFVAPGARGDSQRLEKTAVNVLSFLGPEIVSVSEPKVVDERRPKHGSKAKGEVPSRVIMVGPESRRGGGILRERVRYERKQLRLIEQEKSSKELVLGRQLMVYSRHELVRGDAMRPHVDVVVLACRRIGIVRQRNPIQDSAGHRIDS